MSLFSNIKESELVNMVKGLDLMETTPSQAIGILEKLKALTED